jgi:hypothetical protein
MEGAGMTFLRQVLRLQAALWAITGLALVLVPTQLHRDLFDQAQLFDYVWLRAAGVMAAVLAMLMWLVSQRVAELWWWTWAFAILEASLAALFALNAAFGTFEEVPTWPWWSLAAVSAVVAVLDLAGMAQAGREKPIVP